MRKKFLNIFLSLFILFNFQLTANADDYEFNHEVIDGIEYYIQGKMADEDTVLVYVWGTALEDLEETVVSTKLVNGIGTNNSQDFYGIALYDTAADYVDGHNFASDNGAYIKFNKMPMDSGFVFVLFIPKDKLENNEITLLLGHDKNIDLNKLKELQTKDEQGGKVELKQEYLFNNDNYKTIKVKNNSDLFAEKLNDTEEVEEISDNKNIILTTKTSSKMNPNYIIGAGVGVIILIAILTAFLYRKI